AVADITSQIGRYIRIKLMLSLTTGVLVWLTLIVLKVDFPVTWGTMAFFLNFIPNVGSIAASIPPILVSFLASYPSFWPPVATAVAMLSIQMTMGNLVEPKLQGTSLNLSPVVILFSLAFWGWLWGITGMLVSVPIAAAIKITCENIEPLRPISVFMGDVRNGGKAA
ncbi:AI-2E family transporter, partial [Verrucomicrobiota bacterium]